MGCRILHNASDDLAVLYCSTSMVAFGPVFENSTQAEAFCTWVQDTFGHDPRRWSNAELSEHYGLWLARLTNDRSSGSRLVRFIRACRNAIRCGYDPHDARWWARERIQEWRQ